MAISTCSSFPVAAATNYHNSGGLKKTVILPNSGDQKSEIQVLVELGPLRENPFLASSRFLSCQHSMVFLGLQSYHSDLHIVFSCSGVQTLSTL